MERRRGVNDRSYIGDRVSHVTNEAQRTKYELVVEVGASWRLSRMLARAV